MTVPAAAAPGAPSLRYHRLLRGLPRYRWWKPLLALLVAAFLWVAFQVVVAVAVLAVAFATGGIRLDTVAHAQDDLLSYATLDAARPLTLILALGSVATLLPAVVLSYLIVGLRPASVVRSVAFRIRWRWLAACLVPAVAITAVATVVQLFVLPLALGGWPMAPTTPVGDWIVCTVVILIVTPLQAAAEEFGFRGLFSQMFGSWVRWAPVTIVVAAIPFTVLHTQYWGWATADVAFFALVAGFVTWRTGGLEAGIALHSVNNTLAFLLLASGIYGTTQNQGGAGDPWSLLVTIVTMGLYALWIDRMARRRALKAVLDPLPQPAAPDPASLVAE